MWMKHEHGGIADLPDLPYWRAAGWNPTDERPPEDEGLRDPGVAPPAEETEDPQDPAEAGSSAARPEEAGDDEEMTRG